MQIEMLKSHHQLENETITSLTNQVTRVRNLEVQMSQMASLPNERQHGNLPSASEVNLRREGIEHCKAITLRSGKELEGLRKAKEKEMEAGQTSRSEITKKLVEKGKESKSKASTNNPLPDLIEVPFPQRLWRLQGKNPSQNEENEKVDNKEIQTEKHFV